MHRSGVLFLLAAAVLLASPAAAQMTSCKLKYELEGWSFIYKGYKGTGVVTCDDGQTLNVKIHVHEGGATAGRSDLDGVGKFSKAKSIDELLGTYFSMEGHAGVVRSAEGRVVTKGTVSLYMSATGRGFDVGVAIGAMSIHRR